MTRQKSGSLAASTSDRTLKVLSFNVWGLAIISKERKTRIRAIAQYLASSSYDIVCLQECWVYKDYEMIRDEVMAVLPYSRFFNSGALGSGLAIFTRFPLISAQVMPYDLSGTPQQAIAGDFFVNKSAANVVVQHPILGELEIWSTHMHAGGDDPPETREAHRIAEAWQLSNAVRGGAARGRHVMAMGDFNAQPGFIPIELMLHHGQMTDSFLETHPRANDVGPNPISPEVALRDHGMSCDSPLNTWTAAKNIKQNIRDRGGKRLDYIFYRPPAGERVSREESRHSSGSATGGSQEQRLRCVSSELVLNDLVPGQSFSYSDHAGLFSTFEIGPSESSSNPFSPETTDKPSTFIPAQIPRQFSSPSELIRRARTILADYSILSQRAARLHNRLSVVCVIALLGLTIGSAWQPKSYIQPIFTLLGALLGGAGATFFYLGFLWGRWEAGILAEVLQEMDLELEVLRRDI